MVPASAQRHWNLLVFLPTTGNPRDGDTYKECEGQIGPQFYQQIHHLYGLPPCVIFVLEIFDSEFDTSVFRLVGPVRIGHDGFGFPITNGAQPVLGNPLVGEVFDDRARPAQG